MIQLFLILLISQLQPAHAAKSSSKGPSNDELIKELVNRGADAAFAKRFFSRAESKFDPQYVKVNVLNFQRKDDYSKNLLPESVQTAKTFVSQNQATLDSAEKRFKVKKEVIAALLFIETRYGKNTGSHPLASVFASQAHSNDPEILEETLKAARPDERIEDEAHIRTMARRKTNRALREILALEEMESKHHIPIFKLKGSYSGAVGWPQFLPSSYIQWAATPRKTDRIDLFKTEDAIFSVANYLHQQGFSDTAESQHDAVFHYNNSDDYVGAVLGLAAKIK